MGEVFLQAYDSVEERNTEAQEKSSGKCEFYMSLEVMRLLPIASISISTVLPLENSRHSF